MFSWIFKLFSCFFSIYCTWNLLEFLYFFIAKKGLKSSKSQSLFHPTPLGRPKAGRGIAGVPGRLRLWPRESPTTEAWEGPAACTKRRSAAEVWGLFGEVRWVFNMFCFKGSKKMSKDRALVFAWGLYWFLKIHVFGMVFLFWSCFVRPCSVVFPDVFCVISLTSLSRSRRSDASSWCRMVFHLTGFWEPWWFSSLKKPPKPYSKKCILSTKSHPSSSKLGCFLFIPFQTQHHPHHPRSRRSEWM